jgi:transcriptional regulator with XRE-family HTH domain
MLCGARPDNRVFEDTTMIALHIQLRDARRARGMSQAALAEAVACKQSAISMMESGRHDALSREKLVAIAGVLEVRLDAADAAPGPAAGATVLKICPVSECPSNAPFAVSGQLLFVPLPVRAAAAEVTRCAFCGDVLEGACPNCKAPIKPGACCVACGSAYISATATPDQDLATWTARERERVIQIRALFQAGG